jgi:hypothetical protein
MVQKQTENELYHTAMQPVNDGYAAMEAKEKATPEAEQKSEAFIKQSKLDEKAIEEQENAINKKFIQENPDSYISLSVLQSFAYSADYVDIAPLYEALSPAIKASAGG